ncbi:hypothetical protein SAMN05421664_3220 [Chryseobacterium soldanellicola]|uniref:Uncharacterized protein n=1 Tax=Chryseobacterium soldanellicola TaxID=311333 RepID=A0A1H1FR64_9FLAO|nr:hypothetical protein [Chryseobacterium soldanellicola]SDR03553.1 hypothetical protein SAMN05421664_3220 [Chryseobacterium soldanellicola]
MKKIITSLFFLAAGSSAFAQVGVNTPTPQGSLDVAYVPTKPTSPQGVLFPRLTGDEVQAMTVGAGQNGMFVFATSRPTNSIARTSLITESGLYYYFSADDKWRNVNQIINPSSLFSTSYQNTDMLIAQYTGGAGAADYNSGQMSHIFFVNGTETPFNSSPFVAVRTADNNRGIDFLKSGIYSVTIQFTFVYQRDVAGDGASSPTLPDRLGSQVTYQLVPNFINSPASAYVSNITHNTDYMTIRQGSGLFRISGIAVGNIIVKQDNVVKFIPEIRTSGYWLSSEELMPTGGLSMHITRVSDYTP